MTDACHLPAGFEAGAAMRVGEGATGAAAALGELFSTSATDRLAMGARGQALVERRFSWPVVARQFLEVYGWLAGGGSPPACVRTD
jgi:glycosyltransferase involved in cell wall biosynthesis